MTEERKAEIREQYLELYRKAGIYLTGKEKASVGYWGYHLDREDIGSGGVNYFNSERCTAWELVMLPWQTIPQHLHPPVGSYPGKEETFRCRYGSVHLFVEGESSKEIRGCIPKGRERYFTALHEIVLNQGEQYTLKPGTLHWFQGGENGCVVSEFSTVAMNGYDVYTDPDIQRAREERGEQQH